MTADLRGLAKPIPLIARLNLQYYFDNSSNLIEDVEAARLANLDDPAPCDDPATCEESRHLLTNVERFALGINRTDFFNIGLGFEAPIRVAEDFYLQPLVEWVWNIPVNRQGYDCLYRPDEFDAGTDDGNPHRWCSRVLPALSTCSGTGRRSRTRPSQHRTRRPR